MRWRRWLSSGAVPGAAFVVQSVLLNPWLAGRYPLAWVYAAVTVTAVRAGRAPAIVSAALGYVATDFLYLGNGAFSRTAPHDFLQVVTFALIVGVIVWFAHRARLGQQLAAERAAAALATAEALRQEVRERQAAEGSLRRSEAQLRRMTDAMPEIAFLCDPVGTVSSR